MIGMESLGAVVVIVVYGFGFFGNVFDKFARILYIDETAADDVRFPVQFILVGRKDYRQHAIIGKHSSFPDDAVVDVKVVGIDVDIARLYAVRDGDFVVREGKDFAVIQNETIFWLDAGRNRQFRVPLKHRKLAVDGNEIFRARERKHNHQFRFARMPGSVRVSQGAVDDYVAAGAIEFVDGAVNRFLISGNRGG